MPRKKIKIRYENLLIHYTETNDVKALEALLLEKKDINVNCVNEDGNTALFIATIEKKMNIMQLLL